MSAPDPSAQPFRLRGGAACLLLAATLAPLAAQTIGQRGERLPAPPGPRTLAIRDSTLSAIVAKASAAYRKEANSQTFVLESSEGETKLEWRIGDEERPLPEGARAPAKVVEKRVKFVPHENKLFLRIEALARGAPEGGEPEIRFSGTYEATVLEGTWAGYREGGGLKVRISAADHERYLGEIRKAFFGEATLASHAERYRAELLGVLERKLADPGTTPPQEIEMAGQLVAFVKAHPESFVVTVSPSYEASPEIFVLAGDAMRSTTEKEATTLRFQARLPAVMKGPPGR